MNISNYTGYCGTGAPPFIANEVLTDAAGAIIDPSTYTYTGQVKLKPNGTVVTSFSYSVDVIEGMNTLQLNIADTSTISPGIYRHQTISTSQDGTDEVLLTGEIVFLPVL